MRTLARLLRYSALRLNVHAHVLAIDGVYVRDADGLLVFYPLATPSSVHVADIAGRSESEHDAYCSPPVPGDQLALEFEPELVPGESPSTGPRRSDWLIKYVFRKDIDHCRLWLGIRRWIAAARTPADAARLMAKCGLGPQPLTHRYLPPPCGQAPLLAASTHTWQFGCSSRLGSP
ncbi:MAG: hypothetical protein HRU17_14760 [Polyangiaceae bacterium]|nr:hypothetical protein [Polyangiaceae bacterium]